LVILQSFLIVSDPAIAKHILKDNSKAYSKVIKSIVNNDWHCAIVFLLRAFSLHCLLHLHGQGILAEILDFVMGKGLIPADGEIWRVRRRTIVPALHLKVF